MRAEDFLKQHFRQFYEKNFVSQPPEPEKREFGCGIFGLKISQRHLAFPSHDAFNAFLRSEVPLFVSYSGAKYKMPAARPIEAKGFISADLVYEFDADDIQTDCKQRHDYWLCPKCFSSGPGKVENCTSCGSPVSVKQMFCNECLGETKSQVFRLVKALEEDFGFSGFDVNFSGNAGYHVHLRGEEINALPHAGRIELLDYLTGHSVNLTALGFVRIGKAFHCPQKKIALGWQKKILSGIESLFSAGNAEKVAAIGGISKKKAEELLAGRDNFLEKLSQGILVSPSGRNTKDFWPKIFDFTVLCESFNVDRQTSLDKSKILRVPDTLHGGTGFQAKRVSLDALKQFDPFSDAVVFGREPAKVFVDFSPEFSLKGEKFAEMRKAETELPLSAAIFLVASGRAKPV
ncbi:MAG: hypothetical protein HY394_05845 [Candidatus Diapherotrites archaeon]|nr:hypothetical protein [Candidatus Diapherotrites archaeon]